MKKRKLYNILLLPLCITLFFSSCGKSDQNEKPTPELPLSQKVDDQGLTEVQKEHALELKGKVFGEMPVVGEEDAIYCNLPENATGWEDPVLICHDPVYDILYYVELEGTSPIYALKDGKAEIAVSFPGERLFCRKGKLYFLLDAGTSQAINGAKNGNILSYDPITGDITVLSDEVFDSIQVFQDLIYCRKGGETIEYSSAVDYWFYFFDTGELLAEPKQSPISYTLEGKRYGEYFIGRTYGPYDPSNPDSYIEELLQSYDIDVEKFRICTGMMLCRRDGSESIPLENLDPWGSYYVKGDDILWLATDGIHTYNIPARQETIKALSLTGLFSYELIGNDIYSGYEDYIDITSGETRNLFYMLPNGTGINIDSFYTDGKRIYGLAHENGFSTSYKLFYLEQCSIEEAYGLLSEDPEAFDMLKRNLEDPYNGRKYDGILRVIPMDEGVGLIHK